VVRINDKLIQNSNHLRNEIANAGAFTEINLELIREGKSVKIKLKLDERPQKVGRVKMEPKMNPALEQSEFMGMTVETLTNDKAEKLGVMPGIGVLISKIESGSPAEKAGLRTGMIIQEVERKAVKNFEIFKEIVNEIDKEKGVLLLVTTSGGSRYIFIEEE
jgi:Trypsin-like serine proteases, typically periplasmic, contain C-terminal PDZ domain